MSTQSSIDPIAAEANVAKMLDNVEVCARALRDVTRLVVEGATRSRFPQQNADAAIQQAVGDYVAARYDYERALIQWVTGEKVVFTPSQPALALALQRRVQRNENEAASSSLVAVA